MRLPRPHLLLALTLGSSFLPAMIRVKPGVSADTAASSDGTAARAGRPRTLARAGAFALGAGVARIRAQEREFNAKTNSVAPHLAHKPLTGKPEKRPVPAAVAALARAGGQVLAAAGDGRPLMSASGASAASLPAGSQATLGPKVAATQPVAVDFGVEPEAAPKLSLGRKAAEIRIDLGQEGLAGAGLPVHRAHLPAVPGEELTRLLDDGAESVRFTVRNGGGRSLCFALPAKGAGEAARTKVYSKVSASAGQDLERGLTEFYTLEPQETIQVTTDPTLERLEYLVTDEDGVPCARIELTQD